MILVDTSVWIDHFRRPDAQLVRAIEAALIVQHPFVTIELALGSIPRREATVAVMQRLPQAKVVDASELLGFIDNCGLHGTGIGMVDTQLLASAITERCRLWTRDKRLHAQATRLGLGIAFSG